jgi:uncharacterized protein YfaP (DUF2135 family)
MFGPSVRRVGGWLMAFAAALLVSACGGEPEPLAPSSNIADLITGISARGGAVTGVVVAGAPQAGTAGPTASVTGISSVVNGGSSQVSVNATGDFQRVMVSILGVDGYYDVQLPSGTVLEDLVMNMGSALNAGNMRVRYVLEGAAGLGPMAEQTVRVIRVGTGDVQVSVAWTGESDVDLHVFDPSGEEVYFGNLESASGGTLDLDSNPACNIDNKNNENIVWPLNGAPAGEYRVNVVYYDDCGVERSDWVVTVQVKGRQPTTHTGSFVGDAAANPNVEATRFTY